MPKEGQKPPQTCISAQGQTHSMNIGMGGCTKTGIPLIRGPDSLNDQSGVPQL